MDANKLTKPLYFTPDITDFYPGYEFETLSMTSQMYMMDFSNPAGPMEPISGEFEHWTPSQFTTDPWYGTRIDVIQDRLKTGGIRVPYLTHEHIVSEGWILKETSHYDPKYKRVYEKNNTWLVVDWTLDIPHVTMIPIDPCKEPGALHFHKYTGYIKDVNQLRYLSKMLPV